MDVFSNHKAPRNDYSLVFRVAAAIPLLAACAFATDLTIARYAIGACVAIDVVAFAREYLLSDRSKAPLTPLEIIRLASLSYNSLDREVPFMWNHLERRNRDTCIDVYHNRRRSKIVISVRGTDTSLVGDLREDANLFFHKVQELAKSDEHQRLPTYVETLLEVMRHVEHKYPTCDLYMTGHSLGAACCEAAWTSDLVMKTKMQSKLKAKEKGNENALSDLRLWRCVTWESPGFSVGKEFKDCLNSHRDELDSHVVHYLGAPNVINCLHPHISVNRRYRVFLQKDDQNNWKHMIKCATRNIMVALNWMSIARLSLCATSSACMKASELVQSESCSLINYFFPSAAKGELTAFGLTFREYAETVEKIQLNALQWLKLGIPFVESQSLTAQLAFGNLAAIGMDSVQYVLDQHDLIRHIDSFDVRSGYPLRWAEMEQWPTLSDVASKTWRELLRSSFVPVITEFFSPNALLENTISRMSGYKVRREFIADKKALHDYYNYLGDGFFDKYLGSNLAQEEKACRDEYIRVGKRLPAPLYILG